MTPSTAQGAGQGPLEFPRYFTRAGRDPLTLVPFETRLVEGQEIKAPAAWAPSASVVLAAEAAPRTTHEHLLGLGQSLAEAAAEQGLLAVGSQVAFADEAAWVLARGMGWIGEERGRWVGVLNLLHFCEPVTGRFDLAGLRQAVRLMTMAAAARAFAAQRPREFSVGWTNLAGMFLGSGIPYDSSRAVGIGGNLAAMVLGEASLQASRISQAQPDHASERDKDIVLTGLKTARQAIENLPPTSSVAPPNPEPNRWLMEAASILDAAVLAVSSFGIIGSVPVSPGIPAECDAHLAPIAHGAEAIRTLQSPGLSARPEMKSSLRALGLSEAQRGPALVAIESGSDLLEAGILPEKAPSLRTATGNWSFHPNAQVQMAAAVAPFVAGVLRHRVHLPPGVPADFSQAILATATRLGLAGVTLDTGEPQSPPELAIAAPEPLTIAGEPQGMGVETAKGSEVEPPQVDVAEPVADAERLAQTDAAEEALLEPPLAPAGEETAVPSEAADEAFEPEAGLEAPAIPQEAAQPEQEPLTEALDADPLEGDTTPEEAAIVGGAEESVPVDEPTGEESGETPAADPIPGWELAAAGTAGAALAGAGAAHAFSQAPPADQPQPQESPAEEAQGVQPEEPAEDTPEVQPQEAAAEVDPEAQPDAEPGAGPNQQEVAEVQPEPQEPEWEPEQIPARTLRFTSGSHRVLLHALEDPDGRLIEFAATAYGATAEERALLDSLCLAVSEGLRRGVPLQAFTAQLNQPPLVRDLMRALARAFPETA